MLPTYSLSYSLANLTSFSDGRRKKKKKSVCIIENNNNRQLSQHNYTIIIVHVVTGRRHRIRCSRSDGYNRRHANRTTIIVDSALRVCVSCFIHRFHPREDV